MGICTKRALVLLLLLFAALPACAKTDTFHLLSDLTRQCDSQHKQNACDQIAMLAIEDRNDFVRREALKHIADQALLARVVLDADDADIRAAAVRKLTAQEWLAKVALEDKDAAAREAASWRLNDQALLEKIATKDLSPQVRKAARDKLGAFGINSREVEVGPDGQPIMVPVPPVSAPAADGRGSAAPILEGARKPMMRTVPQAGKAVVIIYRSGVVRLGQPLIVVGPEEVAFPESGIITRELEGGPAVFLATSRELRTMQGITPTDFDGTWTSLPACSRLKWSQLDWNGLINDPPAEIKTCHQELVQLRSKCTPYPVEVEVRREPLGCTTGFRVIVCRELVWYRNDLVTPACYPEISGSELAVTMLQYARTPDAFQERELRVDVKAGRTYYIRWSAESFNLVDDATESKELYETW